ncbi:MAG: LysR family transcriptional regulator [Anaerostipes sp.]|uniref:LysR family transcriptional regulator n=1 Tax=Anaerostipes sp. 992a TaxID=1261637 RepID=UPI000950CCC0|nr:LysR family transcriptional regulator [Anaerostipes sp. 992a]MCI5952211.1 LysR family transcriptional regulator [Anaerostipes sp.]MDD5969260.1 LysR family transcriptional regulator [Anaerostipes sp.]OLR63824.1 LysR family transcriptional regulator [Anaerostipes sp. 992a]
MNLYHLRYFVTLAHWEHYTKAAAELSITQPSLSHAISSLEQELGVNLFEKEGRNIVLTKYGRLFLADVEKSMEILEAGIKTLKSAGIGEGTIDLGFLRTLGTDVVPGFISGYQKEYADRNVNFNLNTGVTEDLLNGLKNKKYDLVLCSKMPKEPSIEFIPVAQQKLVLIVPINHPLAIRNSITLTETLQYPQIIFSKRSGLRPIIDELFEVAGGYPEVVYEIKEDQVIAGFVAKGFGIAVVPDMPILETMDVKKLEINSPNWQRNFYLAFLKDKYISPAAQTFKNYIIEHSLLE